MTNLLSTEFFLNPIYDFLIPSGSSGPSMIVGGTDITAPDFWLFDNPVLCWFIWPRPMAMNLSAEFVVTGPHL